MKHLLYIIIFSFALAFSSCYHNKHEENDNAMADSTATMRDTLDFYTTHHYSIGYNFIVRSDSLCLIEQQPEEHVAQLVTDTLCVDHNLHIAVTDIRIIPQDSIDSVWVQVVSETGDMGWSHERTLLRNVMPTDPISQFIMFFSDTHLLVALVIVVLIIVAYVIRIVQRRQAPIVHFRDIPSFYPTLLCVIVACSATLYASLQMFEADAWQYFYYHPSLNPFSLPPIIGIFITSVWAMLIVSIATVDDVRHLLPFNETILYLCGLSGVCAVLYIIFSISTLYYIGYPLLIVYCIFAIKRIKR